MAVLHEFNTNAKWNAVYRSRRDGLRRQLTYESVLAKAIEDTEHERAEKERERAEKERERAEKERERAEKEHERAEKERERAEKERERAEKEQALQELEKLRAALLRAGVEPDQG